MPSYFRDGLKFRRQRRSGERRFATGKLYPCLEDRYENSGAASGHYFHQDLLVARRIFANQPRRHVDVGSRVDGFVAHVASFRTIEVLDIRPLPSAIPNVKFIQADLMAELPPDLVECCDSLSCLHALEHFGLGRYGDPVNYNGDLIAWKNLAAMVQPGGRFYFSAPIGPQRIEFNAHRVFSVKYLLEQFKDNFVVDRFSYINDQGDLHEDVPLDQALIDMNFHCVFGCGVFELTKL